MDMNVNPVEEDSMILELHKIAEIHNKMQEKYMNKKEEYP